MTDTDTPSTEEPIHVTGTEARAGSRSKMTRYILIISLTLVIVIFAVLFYAG